MQHKETEKMFHQVTGGKLDIDTRTFSWKEELKNKMSG